MNLIETKVTKHNEQAVEDWSMETNTTIRVEVVPFELVVNYNEGEEVGVANEIKKGLKAFIVELQKQVDEL